MALKDPKKWKIAGKPLARLDTADKLTGKQIYGTDLNLLGMLNATVRACPYFWQGRSRASRAHRSQKCRGVRKVMRIDDTTLAVVADTWWQAKTAMDALPIVWDEGPNTGVSSESIAAMLKDGLDARNAFVQTTAGDAPGALAAAKKTISAIYAYPYQNHATMEPMNATARYTPQMRSVGADAKRRGESGRAAAEAAGLPVQQCEVYNRISVAASAGAAIFRTTCASRC